MKTIEQVREFVVKKAEEHGFDEKFTEHYIKIYHNSSMQAYRKILDFIDSEEKS